MGNRGNPELEPFTVNQWELGAEWYFHDEGILGFTYFRKNFSSLIGSETVILQREQSTTTGGTTGGLLDVEFTQPFNTGDANIKGFEVSLQSSLYFLGDNEIFEQSGFIFNYTDLSSEAQLESIDGSQLQPFPNLSPSSLNAGVYYDNGRFDARLNYAWRKGFLQDGLDPAGNFFFQEDFGQLDMTVNYDINDTMTVVGQVNNILGETLDFSSSASRVLVRRLNLPVQAIVGLKVNF